MFLKDMLPASIINSCIGVQLNYHCHSNAMFMKSLNCLCGLLETVGKKLESEPNARSRMEPHG